MPSPATVEAFVATVEAGDYIGAIERFYAPEASMRENGEAPRVGRDLLVEGERRVMSAFARIAAQHQGPIVIDGDRVAIHWRFDFTPAEGPARALEEIAWQRWEGERVVEERFFYDPAQMAG